MASAVRRLLPLDVVGAAVAAVTGDGRWQACEASLIAGGKSNLTFRLSSQAGELILRRPPTGELLPSAHDMSREVRVQRALVGSSVPVPSVVLYDAGALLGVPCYVMTKVAGRVIRDELPAGYADTDEDRLRWPTPSWTCWRIYTRSSARRSVWRTTARLRASSRGSCAAGRGNGRAR